MSPAPVRYEDLIGLWHEGQRRLAAAEPADRPALERVTDELVVQLRRRLGGPFMVSELAQLYIDQGTDWCFDIAVRVAPNTPGGVGHDHRCRSGFRALRPRGDRLLDGTQTRR